MGEAASRKPSMCSGVTRNTHTQHVCNAGHNCPLLLRPRTPSAAIGSCSGSLRTSPRRATLT
jgi:hypothetical protein